MSSTASASAAASATSLSQALSGSNGTGQKNQGISIGSFVASLAAGLAIFGIEFGVFLLINGKLSRIYQPRTFLVPERERTKAPPKGLWQWIMPILKTSNADFIQKCGLDAYFFLRYLRTLLKIFIPLAIIILPILLPLNAVHGRGSSFAVGRYDTGTDQNATYSNVTGLDQLSWGDVRPTQNNRYWVHLVLAVGVVIYTCFVFFDELRGYIRLRQAYLTSPQHRLRASATTVLVTAIPAKWCTFEALNGLYDVFPGGIRNIWVNRNFDELNDKVKQRNKLASSLEAAETNLIRKAKKAHLKMLKAEAKKTGKKPTKEKMIDELRAADARALAMAQTDGISSGDPHQVRHTVDEVMADTSGEPSVEQSPDRKQPLVPIPVLGQGIEAVGHGLDTLGKAVFGGIRKAEKDVDERINTTEGLVPATPDNTAPRSRSRDENAKCGLDGTGSPSLSPKPDYYRGAKDATRRKGQHVNIREPSDDGMVRQSTDSQDDNFYHSSQPNHAQQGLGIDGAPVDPRINGESVASNIMRNPERLGEADGANTSKLQFWKRKNDVPYGIPSPTPHGQEEDEFPLSHPSPMTPGCNPQATINGRGSQYPKSIPERTTSKKSKKSSKQDRKTKNEQHRPEVLDDEYDANSGKPKWKLYLKEKDRETMRLPIYGWLWMISLPFLGQKVDTIDYCRKEVARLNIEIERDQREPEKFPLMNSAFVQFNHQVAAHMACQAVSHHTPSQMASRVVEISPDDVIWDNMSIKWWESYIRTAAAIALTIGLIIGWAFPVTFTGLLSNVTYLSHVSWLTWLQRAPTWVLSIIQGILPQALLALLLILLPMILRLLARTQGDLTGMAVELSVQNYYFAFLFVQVFLVVSISSGITTILPKIANSPQSIPSLLAENLPKASNYFFSYMLLQALSTSAGALVQIMGLIQWFLLAPIIDNTARQKWRRQINLPDMQWGTFFPVYTNLAAIGLIYSIISPLMLIFNIITFSLFWLVYRYNTLYVTKFRFDTGGLLYPRAINQLFTGLYVMELCLIGLFFLVKDESTGPNGKAVPVGTPCKVQAILMIVVLICTIIYQFLLNNAFSPLFRYLPITLEDEAVMRDEEFAKAQEKQWALDDGEQEDDSEALNRRERTSTSEDREAESIEMQDIPNHKEHKGLDPKNLGRIVPEKMANLVPIKASWADRSRNRYPRSPEQGGHLRSPRHHQHRARKSPDVEAQRTGTDAIGEALFAGINDEIEDLTPEERDKLVQRAFQHEALRARRPVIWIPRDDLGISDDEIQRTQRFSRHIWISNEYSALDGKGSVIYRKSPPDFSEVDLIEL